MKLKKKIINNILMSLIFVASLLLSLHIFSNWNDFKAGVKGNCVENL